MFWLKPAAAVAAILTLAAATAPALAGPIPAGSPARMHMIDGTTRMMSDRAQAMRECNAVAARFGQVTWGVTQGHQMRVCMSGRNHVD